MQNIVALVDLDDESSWRKPLATAIEYASSTGAQLHVLSIVPDAMFKMTFVVQPLREDYEYKLTEYARQRLTTLIRKHAVDDVQLDPVVRFGSVYKEALQFARDIEADLIIMGSHKPELKDYLLGSNAAQIVRHAICSVWVVRE
jgi:nucleotide-binding universal stress UspA family protein